MSSPTIADPPTDSLTEQFDQLSHPLRHRILVALNDHDPRERSEFISEEFAGNRDEAERLNIEIRHNHLPKLDDAGFVDWDRETDTVARGTRFEELSSLLVFIEDDGDGRSEA